MSFNIGHALLGAAQGFFMGGPAGAIAGGVAGGFDAANPAAGNASGVAAPVGGASALLGAGGGAESGGLLSIFGLDSIEKTIEHANPATLETALKLFA
jgi:hypothetical protein